MWSSRMTLAALVGAAVVIGSAGGEAEAGKKKAKATASKKKAKKAKEPKRKPNMPAGWSWPPNRAMKAEGDACLEDLTALGVTWEKAKKTKKVATPVVIPGMEFGGVKVKSWWRTGPHVMDCHLAVALATYAPKLYDMGIRTITFSSVYRYDTHITSHGKRSKALSRHALGLAMDVHSFTDAAGNEAIVKDDYLDGNELLLGVEELVNDSGGFRTVLTPRNDPESHDDHFHIEVKVDYSVPREKKPTS